MRRINARKDGLYWALYKLPGVGADFNPGMTKLIRRISTRREKLQIWGIWRKCALGPSDVWRRTGAVYRVNPQQHVQLFCLYFQNGEQKEIKIETS